MLLRQCFPCEQICNKVCHNQHIFDWIQMSSIMKELVTKTFFMKCRCKFAKKMVGIQIEQINLNFQQGLM
jgi:hypothetical protein